MNCRECMYFIKNTDNKNGICYLCGKEVLNNEYCIDFEPNSYNADCLEIMDELIEKGIVFDMVLVDPPYAKTRGRWDIIIPLNDMWDKLSKLVKPNGAICIFGNEPYSSMVRMSNIEDYKYDWKWVKNRATGFANCNYRPMARYEDIMVFSKANASTGGKNNAMIYNPQGLIPSGKKKKNTPKRHGLIQQDTNNVGENNALMQDTEYIQKYTNYPDNVLEFNCESKYIHPTQKPTKLLEYLLNTYSNENDLILDFTAGSFSTAEACLNTKRRYVCIEKDIKYFNIAKGRLENLY